MPSENTFHAWQHTYSPGHHVSPTEYTEIIEFCKSEYYYYAVKAEDKDGEGKVHVHFIGFKEEAKHAPATAKKDLRYGASRKSHILRPADGRFWKKCPQITKCIENKTIGMIMCQLTSDVVIEYYNKETHLVTSHLPDDMCVIRPLLAESHNEKVENNDIINHCTKYQLMKYPMPASPQTVWEYLNCRWFELNDLKLTKQEIHQVALTRSILNMLNKTSLELPKVLERKPMDSKKRKQIESDYQKLDILTRMNHELHSSK